MAAVILAPVTAAAMLFGMMRPETPKQPLGAIAEQTAREGEPRVIVWGIVRPIGGNLITPRKLFRRVRRSNPPVIAGIYAIGVCEGPISRFRRIWRQGKLVYDDTGTEWGRRNNGKFLANFRLYDGSWDQMPDDRLQATFGVDDVSAFRGTAYIVAGLRGRGEDLSDTGGAVPTWTFEVELREGVYLTSKPYPIEIVEELGVSSSSSSIGEFELQTESLLISSSISEASLVELLPPEIEETEGLLITSGISAAFLETLLPPEYDFFESLALSSAIVAAQTTEVARPYDVEPEALAITSTITGATLT